MSTAAKAVRVESETQLAAAVVRYLRDLEWDVHQEVGWPHGKRADIVATRGPLLHVVEVKQSLGLAVMAQAMYWQNWAHLCSVAVPMYGPRGGREGRFVAERVLREWGVGLLGVSLALAEWETEKVREEIAPRLRRRIGFVNTRDLRAQLSDATRTYAQAGNAQGKFWSPFKATCERVLEVVSTRPGMTTREVVASLGQHHYASDASARGALYKWLVAGKIPGVHGDGNPLRWYPMPSGLDGRPT